MSRPPLLFACGLLLAVAATLLRAETREPVFPSDSQDVKQVGGPELLEAVCPGRVGVGKEVVCRGACPAFTGFAGEDLSWSLARVTRGHFLAPASDDVVLAMSGCEPHSENYGGTILLTQRSRHWSMVWYKVGRRHFSVPQGAAKKPARDPRLLRILRRARDRLNLALC